MALKKTQNYKGIPITDAYCRVAVLEPHKKITKTDTLDENGEITGTTTETAYLLSFAVCFSSAENGQEIYRKGFSFPYDLAGANTWIQAYTYLKTLDEFSGALDV